MDHLQYILFLKLHRDFYSIFILVVIWSYLVQWDVVSLLSDAAPYDNQNVSGRWSNVHLSRRRRRHGSAASGIRWYQRICWEPFLNSAHLTSRGVEAARSALLLDMAMIQNQSGGHSVPRMCREKQRPYCAEDLNRWWNRCVRDNVRYLSLCVKWIRLCAANNAVRVYFQLTRISLQIPKTTTLSTPASVWHEVYASVKLWESV